MPMVVLVPQKKFVDDCDLSRTVTSGVETFDIGRRVVRRHAFRNRIHNEEENMTLGMLRAQPRHVVAKLAGMSSAEESEVLKDLPPAERQADGTPLYRFAECRRKLEEVRNEPVSTVKSASEELLRRQSPQFDSFRQTVEQMKHEIALLKENREKIVGHVTAATKAVTNAVDEPLYLTTKDVARLTDLPVQTIRRYCRKGSFSRSRILGSRGNGKHAKFDPNRLWDDIAELEKKRSGK